MRNRAKTDALGLPIRSEIGFRVRNKGSNQNESEISPPKRGLNQNESEISGQKTPPNLNGSEISTPKTAPEAPIMGA